MLKFKTFDIIMVMLQVAASSIATYWGYKWTPKNNVFFHITGLAATQTIYSIVGAD